ncbi:MAG: alpha/beta fold hydrolase [Planctomycetaceae bacterium]
MSREFDTALSQPIGTPDGIRGSGKFGTVTASDGYKLKFRHWKAQSPRGIVVAVHGIQSHSGWYEYSSWHMANAGFDVYLADRRGSGVNGLDRGHADHGLRLVNDVRTLIRHARAISEGKVSEPRMPLCLAGISWGGKIAAATAALFPNEIDQLAFLYPGLEPRLQPSFLQRIQLRAARDFDVRRRQVPVPLSDPTMFTANPFWQRAIAADPLALHTVTSGFINSGYHLDMIVRERCRHIAHPLLLMLAGQDQIIDNDRTQRRIMTFSSNCIHMHRYPQARHTLEFEENRNLFVGHIIAWLREQTRRDSSGVTADSDLHEGQESSSSTERPY